MISSAAIAAIHHDLNSRRSRPAAARMRRDGAEIRPFVLPKVISPRPAPTIIGIADSLSLRTTEGSEAISTLERGDCFGLSPYSETYPVVASDRRERNNPRARMSGMATGFALAMTGEVSVFAEQCCAVESLAMTR
jgi:hypothetical protein